MVWFLPRVDLIVAQAYRAVDFSVAKLWQMQFTLVEISIRWFYSSWTVCSVAKHWDLFANLYVIWN